MTRRCRAREHRSTRGLIFACAVWVSLASVVATQERPGAGLAGTGLIAGRVVDATSDQPIAGVTVSLRTLSGVAIEAQVDAAGRVTRVTRPSSPSVVTDSQGRFVFSALPPGGYAVMPQRPGFTGTGSAFVELADAERKIDVPLVMGRRSSISGAVRDDAGDPVVGAVVMVFLRSTMGGVSPILMPRGNTTTDDHGRYRIAGLANGDYFVCACGTQEPIVDGALLATLAPPRLTADLLAVRADRTLKTFAPTFYPGRIKASEATLVPVDFADDRTGIDISLTAVSARRVSGRIVAPANAVAGELGLYLVGVGDLPEAQTLSQLTAVPGHDGGFEFVGVPSGDYTIEAFSSKPAASEPRLWASLPVSVREEDILDVEVALRVGVAVNGRVDFVGQRLRPGPLTLEKTRLSLFPVDLTTAILSAVGSTGTLGHGASLGTNGGFRIENVMPGRYLVRGGTVPPEWQSIGAVSADGQFLPDAVITVGANGLSNVLVTVVDAPLATVEGRVTLRPYDLAQEFFACVFPADRALWEEPFRNPERFACQSVSAKGTYRLPTVPPGDYFVALRHMWLVDWIAPRQLEAFARMASRISAKAGETTVVNLKR